MLINRFAKRPSMESNSLSGNAALRRTAPLLSRRALISARTISGVIPARLSFDPFEVGVGSEGAEATRLGRERIPGMAAGVHDGLVIDEQTVREVALPQRSEEHTSELQSHSDLVCRLL